MDGIENNHGFGNYGGKNMLSLKRSPHQCVSVDILGFEFRVITAQKKLALQKSTGGFCLSWRHCITAGNYTVSSIQTFY